MRRIGYIALVIFVLWLVSFSLANIFKVSDFSEKIAIIPIYGEISLQSGSSFGVSSYTGSEDIIKFIEQVENDPTIVAIMFDINSGGGGVVASKEIAKAISEMKKPNVAVIREVGASGAYWAASATDKIYADDMSMTGSIGVFGSYLEFSGLMEKYGIGYEQLIAGDYKDMGVPYRKLTAEEKFIIQKMLDKIHENFINEVAKNRHVDVSIVKKWANGNVYLGIEAYDMGMIDAIGGKKEAEEYLKQRLNITEVNIITMEQENNLWSMLDAFSSKTAFAFGKGVSSAFEQQSLAKV
ncbi:signal peptide peptidase SppA [Candidatus Woesearchaeota archaeon]|nr:signal peptide peptidase SppA [Candidatus Woesearchaeota archaeon]